MSDSDHSDLGSSPTRIDSRALRLEIGKAFTWGIVIGLLVLAAGMSVLRWPVRYLLRWVRRQVGREEA